MFVVIGVDKFAFHTQNCLQLEKLTPLSLSLTSGGHVRIAVLRAWYVLVFLEKHQFRFVGRDVTQTKPEHSLTELRLQIPVIANWFDV